MVNDKKKTFFEILHHNSPPTIEINGFLDFSKAILMSIKNKQNSDHIKGQDFKRTIYIDTKGIDILDFNLDENDKKLLIQSGAEAVEAYFSTFKLKISK